MGLPFELDVSFTLEGMGWALRQKHQRREFLLDSGPNYGKGQKSDTPQ